MNASITGYDAIHYSVATIVVLVALAWDLYRRRKR
jgi:hypothetical protein